MSLGLEHVNGCAWIFFEPQPTLQGQGEALEGGQGGMKPSFLEIVDSVPPSTDPGCASMLGFFLHECSGVQVLWAFCQTLHRGVIRYATWREEAGKSTKIECQPRPVRWSQVCTMQALQISDISIIQGAKAPICRV